MDNKQTEASDDYGSPEHFFKSVEILQNTTYFSKAFNHIRALLDMETVQKEVKEIRSKFGIPNEGLELYQKQEFKQEVFDATRLLVKKLKLGMGWGDVVENYVIYNRVFTPEFPEVFEVLNLRTELSGASTFPDNPEDLTQKDIDYDNLKDLSKDYPVALLIPARASQRDIIDFVKKIFKHSILPIQQKYKNEVAEIGKHKERREETRRRNQFIYEHRDLPRKEIMHLVNDKFNINIDYGLIGKIISIENNKRKDVNT